MSRNDLNNLRENHTENLKKVRIQQPVRTRKITVFEAQITVKHQYPLASVNDCEIECRISHNSVIPYASPIQRVPATAQDTLWGDIKTKAIPGILDSFSAYEYYKKQSDFVLNLEYDFSKVFTTPLKHQDVFNIASSMDNVLIEEYEADYEWRFFFFRSSRTITYHRIVKIDRNGQVLLNSLLEAQPK